METVAKKIYDVDFKEEIEKSYLLYSYHVIENRAIPLIIDGFKPVQRRILWYMFKEKMYPDSHTYKSLRISSGVIGIYHPHGDAYGPMVGLAAEYGSLALIHGQGAWGATYGAKPAAPRYTEAKLSEAGMLSLKDSEFAPMIPNYDGRDLEPGYLYPAFPNLVINGAEGIAVGYACKFAEHNPGEAMDLAIAMVRNKDYSISIDEMLEIMPGPDFKTGGIVIGQDQIRSYYETGKGNFILQGEATIEDLGRGRSRIVVSSLPRVSVASYVDSVKELVKEGTLSGVTDVENLTDRKNGLRVAITLKRGVNAQQFLKLLYAKTELRKNFSVNATAINESGVPEVVSMQRMMTCFIENRMVALLKRTKAKFEANEKKISEANAILAVLLDIDKAFSIIRDSENGAKAKAELVKYFSITGDQAEYILGLQLRKLTKSDRHKIDQDKQALEKENERLSKIINDDSIARKELIKEFKETKKVIDRDRECSIENVEIDKVKEELKETLIVEEATPQPFVITKNGARLAKAGEESISPEETLWAVFQDGTAGRVDPLTIGRKESFNILSSHAEESHGKTFVDIASVANKVIIVSKDGQVKITDMATMPKTHYDSDIIPSRDNVCVETLRKPYLVMVTSEAKALKIDLEKIRAQGRTGNGVAGIKLPEGARLIAAFNADDDDNVYTLTNDSHKVTPVRDIPVKGRGTGGVGIHLFRKADVEIVEARLATGNDVEPTPRGKSGTKL